MSPILGIFASSKFAAAGDYESIATVTVGSGGSATVEFTSIPADYTHLQIRAIARNTSDVYYVALQINSDTGANYAYHRLSGDGSAASAGAGSSENQIYLYPQANTANMFSGGVIDILDYKNTNKYKTVRALGGYDQNGSGRIELVSGLWQSTSAITSLKFSAFAGNYGQYSHFALYGCKI